MKTVKHTKQHKSKASKKAEKLLKLAKSTYAERTERQKMWLDFVLKLLLVAAMVWLKLDEKLLAVPFIGDVVKMFWKKKEDE